MDHVGHCEKRNIPSRESSLHLNSKRMVADLRGASPPHLRRKRRPAGRVYAPPWVAARAWLGSKLKTLPVETHVDAAGNLWATLPGASEKALLIGGHLDSVPNGGWLDGCLGVLAGVEILRRIAAEYDGKPPVTVRLVDWADEEGARFGKSLVRAFSVLGSAQHGRGPGLKDENGIRLPVTRSGGWASISSASRCRSREAMNVAAAYSRIALRAGSGAAGPGLAAWRGPRHLWGRARYAITSFPRPGGPFRLGHPDEPAQGCLSRRIENWAPEIYHIAGRHGGVCTIGSCATKPGVATSVVAECRITLDQRHLDPAALARMLQDARDAAERFAREGNVGVSWSRTDADRADAFHTMPFLPALRRGHRRDRYGKAHRLPSGPLHDAAEVARSGIPAVMMFVQSLHGISHNKIEDTKEEHLELCVTALDRLANKAMKWVAASR